LERKERGEEREQKDKVDHTDRRGRKGVQEANGYVIIEKCVVSVAQH